MLTREEIKEYLEVCDASTEVVGWYAYPSYSQCGGHQATVRGPFNRWFYVQGGEEWIGKSKQRVATLEEDAKFCSLAMTEFKTVLLNLERALDERDHWKDDRNTCLQSANLLKYDYDVARKALNIAVECLKKYSSFKGSLEPVGRDAQDALDKIEELINEHG